MRKQFLKLAISAAIFVAGDPLFCQTLAPTTQAQDIQTKIEALDQQINEFTQARKQYVMMAYVAGNKADQLIDQDWLGYRQAIRKQQEYEQNVVWLDQKIEELKKQKEDLKKTL